VMSPRHRTHHHPSARFASSIVITLPPKAPRFQRQSWPSACHRCTSSNDRAVVGALTATGSLYAIRPATSAERDRIGASWRTLLSLPKGGSDATAGTRMVGLGRFELARGELARAIADRIDEHLDHDGPVLVADHPDAPGLALGWIAFEVDPTTLTIRAMHVNADDRGSWVGRSLLAHVLREHGLELRCSMMTPGGRKLLEHVQRDERAKAA